MSEPAKCTRCAGLAVKDDALANLVAARDAYKRTAPFSGDRDRAIGLVERCEGQVTRANDLLDLLPPHTCELKP